MDKIEKSAVIAVLFLVIAVIGMCVLPATAADVDVVVTRDLPDEPVSPKEVITVTLTQSGFFKNVGWVNETLPEGFTYVVGSVADGDGYPVVIDADYNETTDKISIPFGYSENNTTMTYKVEADTLEHIREAEFSGTWTTISSLGPPVEYQTGEVTGDTKLTAAEEEPTPTPTPSYNGGSGGNSGGGNGISGGTTSPAAPTPTPGETPATSPTPGATLTPTVTASPTPVATVSPAPTPTPSPARKPWIPGFEVVFAIAGLLTVAYLVLWRKKKV